MTNTMSAEFIYGMDAYEAECCFQDISKILLLDGEDESEIEEIANMIMDNAKLYPEYFSSNN